jgi:hypothetical protein
VQFSRRLFPLLSLLVAVSLIGGGALYAQLEGADRGVPPIDSASTLEVTGVEVDVTAKTSDEARFQGWREAQAKGWKALWAKTTGQPIAQAPALTDAVLNSIVSGIIIEQEQIGPTRYIARLGLLFDRARAGQLLGVGPLAGRRSAPLLVVPVMITGSVPYSFEFRNEWQKAWARFRTGGSAIDYVRPTGSGIDPLLLNAMQTRRPGRAWWRMLLDQYGAADVIVPEVHLKRLYPGGPAIGTFTARFGPDNQILDRFTLRVGSSGNLARLLDEGVRRLDASYIRALEVGALTPDPTLIIEEPEVLQEAAEKIEAANERPEEPAAPSTANIPVPLGAATSFSVRVDTPSGSAIQQAEISVSRIPGITSALTVNPSAGGTSMMRVTFVGDLGRLAAALQAQGWLVSEAGGTSLRISRPGSAPPAAPPPTSPQPQPPPPPSVPPPPPESE